MTDLERLLEEHMRRAQAEGWERGFYEGQRYGQACERYDPNRDSELDEPTQPTNPYRR